MTTCVDCGREIIGEEFECVQCQAFMCAYCARIDDMCSECINEDMWREHELVQEGTR